MMFLVLTTFYYRYTNVWEDVCCRCCERGTLLQCDMGMFTKGMTRNSPRKQVEKKLPLDLNALELEGSFRCEQYWSELHNVNVVFQHSSVPLTSLNIRHLLASNRVFLNASLYRFVFPCEIHSCHNFATSITVTLYQVYTYIVQCKLCGTVMYARDVMNKAFDGYSQHYRNCHSDEIGNQHLSNLYRVLQGQDGRKMKPASDHVGVFSDNYNQSYQLLRMHSTASKLRFVEPTGEILMASSLFCTVAARSVTSWGTAGMMLTCTGGLDCNAVQ